MRVIAWMQAFCWCIIQSDKGSSAHTTYTEISLLQPFLHSICLCQMSLSIRMRSFLCCKCLDLTHWFWLPRLAVGICILVSWSCLTIKAIFLHSSLFLAFTSCMKSIGQWSLKEWMASSLQTNVDRQENSASLNNSLWVGKGSDRMECFICLSCLEICVTAVVSSQHIDRLSVMLMQRYDLANRAFTVKVLHWLLFRSFHFWKTSQVICRVQDLVLQSWHNYKRQSLTIECVLQDIPIWFPGIFCLSCRTPSPVTGSNASFCLRNSARRTSAGGIFIPSIQSGEGKFRAIGSGRTPA